jgi:hypothetical protein
MATKTAAKKRAPGKSAAKKSAPKKPAKVKPIPAGYHSATPYLIVDGAARAIEFYKQAFGAKELMRIPAPGTSSTATARAPSRTPSATAGTSTLTRRTSARPS